MKYRVWNKFQKKLLDTTEPSFLLAPSGQFWLATKQGLYKVSGNKEFEIQFSTGKMDKNSKEIYEGDILLCINRRENRYVEVLFRNGTFLFENRLPMEFLQYNEVEVAGNIIENPDLLPKFELIHRTVETEKEPELAKCKQCDEQAWDGRICHSCGLKEI